MYALNDDVTYFDSFGVEHFPKEIKTFIDKSIAVTNTNILFVMCGYFCIGFIDFMFAGKTLTDFTILFSPNHFKKNDGITECFMTNV